MTVYSVDIIIKVIYDNCVYMLTASTEEPADSLPNVGLVQLFKSSLEFSALVSSEDATEFCKNTQYSI